MPDLAVHPAGLPRRRSGFRQRTGRGCRKSSRHTTRVQHRSPRALGGFAGTGVLRVGRLHARHRRPAGLRNRVLSSGNGSCRTCETAACAPPTAARDKTVGISMPSPTNRLAQRPTYAYSACLRVAHLGRPSTTRKNRSGAADSAPRCAAVTAAGAFAAVRTSVVALAVNHLRGTVLHDCASCRLAASRRATYHDMPRIGRRGTLPARTCPCYPETAECFTRCVTCRE